LARQESITCDVCSAVKQASNHWFVLLKTESRIQITQRFDAEVLIEENETTKFFDLCGESCVLKKVSELIGNRT
jgi:hypothetical protein